MKGITGVLKPEQDLMLKTLQTAKAPGLSPDATTQNMRKVVNQLDAAHNLSWINYRSFIEFSLYLSQ